MIWSSRVGKLGVVLASVGAHGLAAFMLVGAPEIRVEGGADNGVQARLGNSFADMVAGTLAPETPDLLDEVDPTAVAEPATPQTSTEQIVLDKVVEATGPETIPTVDALTTERVIPEEPVPALRANVRIAESDTPTEQIIAPDLPADETPPVSAFAPAPVVTDPSRADLAAASSISPIEPLPPASSAAEPKVIEAGQEPPTIVAAESPPETVQALPDNGVRVSSRPQRRPKRVEQAAEPRQPIESVRQGNAEDNAVAGSETGSDQAVASRQSTSSGQSTTAGNAAASNYPGRIMRCVSRAGRLRVNSRGTAVVAFSIASNGRVGQVRLARSSGNARLDRAAIQTVSRAGPCPTPPQGAQRTFQISVKGRG